MESHRVTTLSLNSLNVSGISSSVLRYMWRSHPLRWWRILSYKLWLKCFQCLPWRQSKLSRDGSVSVFITYTYTLFMAQRTIENCQETVGRERGWSCSEEVRPIDAGWGSDDCRANIGYCPLSRRQCESGYGRYATLAWFVVADIFLNTYVVRW